MGEGYEDWTAAERTVFRINEKLHTINVSPPDTSGGVVVPNIYLNRYYVEYEEGRSIYDILDEICDIVRNVPERNSVEKMISRDNLLEHVIPVLINAEVNTEYLETLPHGRFHDLAVVYRAVFNVNGNEHLGTTITWDMLTEWGVTYDALKIIADINSDKKAGVKIFEVNDIHTITNRFGVYGAIKGLCDTETLSELADMFKDDLYIVPSSIHEVFVVPCDCYCLKALRSAADGAIAAGVLSEKEFLSKNIYRYVRETKEVEVA